MAQPCTLTVLLVGIDGAGKTSLLNTLQGRFAKEPRPSQGFEQVQMQLDEHTKVNMYDLAGNAKMRDIWVNYYGDVHGVIFMVDAADAARMGESAKTFKQIMSHKLLSNKPVLLVGNKQDVDGAATSEALRSTFGVGALQNVVVSCFSAKAKSEAEVDERLEPALECLLGVCKDRYDELQQPVTVSEGLLHGDLCEGEPTTRDRNALFREFRGRFNAVERAHMQPVLDAYQKVCTLTAGKRDTPVVPWEADKPVCSECERLFTQIRRRHHCRLCGRNCCDDCAPSRPFRQGGTGGEPVTQCRALTLTLTLTPNP